MNLIKLGIMIKTTKLYILISVWMTLMFIEGHSCMRNKSWHPFSRERRYRFGSNSDCHHNLLVD